MHRIEDKAAVRARAHRPVAQAANVHWRLCIEDPFDTHGELDQMEMAWPLSAQSPRELIIAGWGSPSVLLFLPVRLIDLLLCLDIP